MLKTTEPIPMIMRTLERDHRGYPIPFIVMRDKNGKPHFTINDTSKVDRCLAKKLCAICGKTFERTRRFLPEGWGYWPEYWFVGGSRCFLHDFGAFIDPPVHQECGQYALIVCPFLAGTHWSGRIDGKTLRPGTLPDDMTLMQNEFMLPALPERFGFGMARDYRMIGQVPNKIMVVDNWHYVEWWRAGERIDAPDTAHAVPDEAVRPAKLIKR